MNFITKNIITDIVKEEGITRIINDYLNTPLDKSIDKIKNVVKNRTVKYYHNRPSFGDVYGNGENFMRHDSTEELELIRPSRKNVDYIGICYEYSNEKQIFQTFVYDC